MSSFKSVHVGGEFYVVMFLAVFCLGLFVYFWPQIAQFFKNRFGGGESETEAVHEPDQVQAADEIDSLTLSEECDGSVLAPVVRLVNPHVLEVKGQLHRLYQMMVGEQALLQLLMQPLNAAGEPCGAMKVVNRDYVEAMRLQEKRKNLQKAQKEYDHALERRKNRTQNKKRSGRRSNNVTNIKTASK